MSGNNVIVFMTDEHTRSVMGAYGNRLAHTPNLDRLATRGVRFDNAYTPSPICISARASFATGMPVFEHRCWSSAEPYYGQHQSWMMRLRDCGHRVESIGKLHFRSGAEDHGFNAEILPMYLTNGGAGWVQGLLRKPLGDFAAAAQLAATLGPGETEYTQYDRRITAVAVDWLESNANSPALPWVLFVSFICPHFPLSAPEEHYNRFRDIELPVPYDCDPALQLHHPVIDQMRQFWAYQDFFHGDAEAVGLKNYYALCSFADANIGRVLDALAQCGQAESTLVIYTSDHGDLIGNHRIWGKSFMYEDSVGIPMLMAGPGIAPGVNPTPVSLTDLASTIERAVTGEIKPGSDPWCGRALQEIIAAADYERPILSEYHDGGSPCGIFMLRRGRWKLVYFTEGYAPLLFDIERDPEELHNLAELHGHTLDLANLIAELNQIVDPEAVNRAAFADQANVIAQLGGLDAVRKMPTFNHTPIETQ